MSYYNDFLQWANWWSRRTANKNVAVGDNFYRCPACYSSFYSDYALRLHLRSCQRYNTRLRWFK